MNSLLKIILRSAVFSLFLGLGIMATPQAMAGTLDVQAPSGFTTNTLFFSDQSINTESAVQSVKLVVAGGPVVINAIGLENPNFMIRNNLCNSSASRPVAASCTFDVVFTPTTAVAGWHYGEIIIKSDATNSPIAYVQGNATVPPIPSCSAIAPSTQSFAAGNASAPMAATCSNTPTAYVWKLNGVTDVSQTGSTYTIPASANGSATTHTVTVTANNASGTGSVAATATVTVTPPLSACSAIAPASQNVLVGAQSSQMTATCTNSPTAYVWKLDGVTDAGQTGSTYTILASANGSAATHTVTVTANNAGGTGVTAATASVVVSTAPLSACTAIAPTSQNVTIGNASAAMTATCSNTPTAYVWKLNGTTDATQTGSTYTIPASANGSAATHTVTVTANNAGGTGVTAATASVVVSTAPLSACTAIAPTSQNVTIGNASAAMTATCSNTPTAYVWKLNGTTDATQTGSTYTIPASANGSATTHTVTVTANNAGGSGVVAATASVTVIVASAPTGPSVCNTTANQLSGVTLVNTNTPLSLTATGLNNNWLMNRGQSRSVEFLTGAAGAQGNFMFDNSTIGQPVAKFRNISRTQCDFSYTQADSGVTSGFNSSACTGNLYAVQNVGDTPIPGRCSLLPNTTYYLNIRNENIVLLKGMNQRGIDTCAYSACGFVFTIY